LVQTDSERFDQWLVTLGGAGQPMGEPAEPRQLDSQVRGPFHLLDKGDARLLRRRRPDPGDRGPTRRVVFLHARTTRESQSQNSKSQNPNPREMPSLKSQSARLVTAPTLR